MAPFLANATTRRHKATPQKHAPPACDRRCCFDVSVRHETPRRDQADFLFFLSSSTSVNSASTTSSFLVSAPAPPEPPSPRGVPQIEVTFDIDANGIVNVHAKDKATGKEQQIRIQASGGLSEADIEKMVKDAEAHAEDDKKRKAAVEAKNHGEALIHATEKALAEHGSKVEEGERRAIENAMADLKEALKGDDGAAIAAKTNTLAQVSMKLGEAMYKQSQESAAAPGATEGAEAKKDDVVDAEFTEVDDDKKNKKSA